MANNRVYLRCKGCGGELMLGKLFSGNWHFTVKPESKGIQLADFFQKHSDCCKGLENDTCGGISSYDYNFEPFELTYENREDWGMQPTLQQKDKQLHPEKYK